ncbi:RNA-directed DNA polymerase, eukaryota, reverse transcriptase zinc-binding domain protein [Tanacetum coccineum]
MTMNIRNGLEATHLNGLLDLLSDCVIVDTLDRWACFFISSKTYTAALMRKQLEHSLLSSNGETIRWNRDLLIKINIHSWRLSLDRIPTRFNLDKRGIDLHSTRCPLCDCAIETSQHLFVECPIAAHIWDSVTGWWGLSSHPKDLLNLITWSDTVNLDNKIKTCLDVKRRRRSRDRVEKEGKKKKGEEKKSGEKEIMEKEEKDKGKGEKEGKIRRTGKKGI